MQMGEQIIESDHIFTGRTTPGGAGLTAGIKDSIDVAGFPTRCGSAVLRDAPPAAADADVVSRLIEEGVHIVGKTNMHEFAYGLTGINGWAGTPRNARYPGRVPGGSSSGSAAAVAAGLVDIAIGTDTGGSIRVPAACCGVFGLKPGFDRVSRRGVLPVTSTLDCIGPFARNMATLTRAMEMIDPSFRRMAMPDVDAVRLGVVRTTAEKPVSDACDSALARTHIATKGVVLPSLEAAFDAGLTLIAAETFLAVGQYVDDPAMGEDVRARLLGAQQVTAEQCLGAEAVRDAFRAEVDAALEAVDAIALPTLPIIPPTIEAAADARASLRLSELVRPFNVSGHPALSIPLDSIKGAPVSLQLIGKYGREAELCALGSLIAAQLNINLER